MFAKLVSREIYLRTMTFPRYVEWRYTSVGFMRYVISKFFKRIKDVFFHVEALVSIWPFLPKRAQKSSRRDFILNKNLQILAIH